jgi:Putative transposase
MPSQLLPLRSRALASVPPGVPGRPRSHAAGELEFFNQLARLKIASAFRAYLAPLRSNEWVVYAKRPFAGPSQVLTYLARYTHRVAIGNSRLLSLSDGKVRFRWKDYRANSKTAVMTLEAAEFIRRFLLHVLPDGFHRIRHYGLFANGHRAEKVALCRKLLQAPAVQAETPSEDHDQASANTTDSPPCPCCGGRMRIIETFDGPLSRPYYVRRLDGP